jgi:hypothetical protein
MFMRCTAIAIVSAGVLLLASGQPAAAQRASFPQYGNMNTSPSYLLGPQGFPNQPALSPWLNMLRGGNPAANYFLGVLPEYDRRYFQAGVSSLLPGLESSAPGAQGPNQMDITAIPVLNQTGHLSAFGAYGMYYNMPVQLRPFYPLNPYQARTMPR